jgi:magnesium-transporting ATPase (P-type)
VLWTKDERGKAYVQTAQLDGERTLKPKFAPLEVQTAFHDIFTRHSEPGWKFRIDSIAPSKDLYYFEGKITWNSGGKDSTCDVNLNQFLHRGATLRNSGKVYALVVHTGTETKQVMNFGEYQHKKPRFERFFNLVIGGNLILMLVLCAGLTLANRAWNENHHLTHEHIFFRSELTEITAKVFFSFLIMTSSLIALNVEVSLQI